ncbi:MAG: aminoglycoside phosphotransferase family protein [Gammaproteobacteria bacterium]
MTERLKLLHEWLDRELGLTGYTLAPASEDASFRRYFRVSRAAESMIVMDAPPDKEDCRPYIEITGRLLACRVNVPRIRACDPDRGFLLLDDLGTKLYLYSLTEDSSDRLYADAVKALLQIQAKASVDGLRGYDATLLQEEMTLFRDWLLEQHLQLNNTWQKLLDESFALLEQAALEQPQVFVHRDYHSRNLLVTEQHNPGIVDFQDALKGPLTYDAVSLFKDCYIKWPRSQVIKRALDYRRQACAYLGIDVSEQQFLRWFDLMGVQRQLKASGIFTRLCHRDGKAGFLQDIPRTLSYILELEGEYPELRPLIALLREHVLPGLEHTHIPCAQ